MEALSVHTFARQKWELSGLCLPWNVNDGWKVVWDGLAVKDEVVRSPHSLTSLVNQLHDSSLKFAGRIMHMRSPGWLKSRVGQCRGKYGMHGVYT
eukprot:1153856-Pelagomonas_calceolata.AAC.1